jgi:hypothetical protein
MKDLITAIGAVMILMVFVMQFCANQVLASRILMADAIIDNIFEAGQYKDKLAECFDCNPNDVIMEKNNDKLIVKMPINNVVAAGKFLGISDEANRSMYTREILLK